jgi:acyl-CoA synthetase (AMP-forming)/AMP-acid ligase II
LLEERLMNHPDVGDAAVFGVEDPEQDEVPVAVVYAHDGHRADPDEIRAWINTRVPPHSAIRRVFVVEPSAIPRGMTGKVLRRVLRERYGTTFKRTDSNTTKRPS